ncbi:MAG: branched-chain amino acid ABC transporter permease [bacterium]|nr:branched-chain amino acid ABC transporter permease [bacterium]
MDYIISGLTMGGAYALIAVGYTMVYGIIGLINFAHGEIYMFGAYFVFAMIVETSKNTSFLISLFMLVIFGITIYLFLRDKFSPLPSLALSLVGGSFLSGFTFFLFLTSIPFYLAFLLSMIFTSCLGMAIEFIAYRPLRDAPRLAALITAIGMSLILQNVARLIWGARTRAYPDQLIPSIIKTQTINGEFLTDKLLSKMSFFELLLKGHKIRIFGDTYISSLKILIILLTILIMIILHLIIHKTKIGKAMRACAQDKVTASLMGIDTDRIITYTFAIGSGMGAVAGILNGLAYHNLSPTMGYKAGVVAFAAAVLGGIGNIPGAMVGGFILGLAQSIAAWIGLSQWIYGVAYAVMILFIVLRPTGIFGKATAR